MASFECDLVYPCEAIIRYIRIQQRYPKKKNDDKMKYYVKFDERKQSEKMRFVALIIQLQLSINVFYVLKTPCT